VWPGRGRRPAVPVGGPGRPAGAPPPRTATALREYFPSSCSSEAERARAMHESTRRDATAFAGPRTFRRGSTRFHRLPRVAVVAKLKRISIRTASAASLPCLPASAVPHFFAIRRTSSQSLFFRSWARNLPSLLLS
jgi:hypothetical protein